MRDYEEPKECRVCKNNGNDYCFACDNGSQFKPQTNADRIRSMSEKELADWIAQILTYHTIASSDPHKDECHTDCPLYRCCNDQPYDNIEDWLKSPVEESE